MESTRPSRAASHYIITQSLWSARLHPWGFAHSNTYSSSQPHKVGLLLSHFTDKNERGKYFIQGHIESKEQNENASPQSLALNLQPVLLLGTACCCWGWSWAKYGRQKSAHPNPTLQLHFVPYFLEGFYCLQKSEGGAPGWLSGWASAFGSGHDPRVLGSSPIWAPPQGACFSLCLWLGLSLSVSHE